MERTISQNQIKKLQEYKVPKVLEFLFLLYIFIKPFYIFESGNFQPGDVVFVFAFAAYLYYNFGANLIPCKFDYILIIFLFFVFLINFIYYSIYFDFEFMKSTLHYVFNICFVLVARVLVIDASFLKKLFWVCRAGIFLQLATYFLGIGRFYYDEASQMESTRFMGTLNDPNQLAFFAFSLLMIMFIIEKIPEAKCSMNLLDYAAFVYIMFLTSSTGMLLALVTFGVSYIFVLMFSPLAESDEKTRLRLLKILLIVVVLLIVFLANKDYFLAEMQKSELFSRLLEKENLTTSTTGSKLAKTSIWQDRNIDKVYLYPIYNIFGAGQGHFIRFWKANSSGEVHSTILSIIFCYGIIPTTVFLYWVWSNLKHTSFYFLPAFLAIAVESVTLLNQRQPTFWLLFILAYGYRVLEDKRYEDAFYT